SPSTARTSPSAEPSWRSPSASASGVASGGYWAKSRSTFSWGRLLTSAARSGPKRRASASTTACMLSQSAGAILASVTLRLMFPTSITLGGTNPADGALQSFVMELLLTLILMFVILSVSFGAKEKGLLAGVAIGVAAMTVVLSVINGFETELRNRFLAANAHILAFNFPGGLDKPDLWAEKIQRDFGVHLTGMRQ
ncbi:MAG: hypothetical protein EBU49_14455, partial [Proteobacteria bacterium]|nr:hypothetical protein [Pseudomonadota bacterium]